MKIKNWLPLIALVVAIASVWQAAAEREHHTWPWIYSLYGTSQSYFSQR